MNQPVSQNLYTSSLTKTTPSASIKASQLLRISLVNFGGRGENKYTEATTASNYKESEIFFQSTLNLSTVDLLSSMRFKHEIHERSKVTSDDLQN